MHTYVLFGTFVDNSGNGEFRISAVEWVVLGLMAVVSNGSRVVDQPRVAIVMPKKRDSD